MRTTGEVMAKCFIGEVDLGEIMILSGHAREWHQYSQGFYSQVSGEGLAR
jgi:endonuclease YncB( thermonuclease family)